MGHAGGAALVTHGYAHQLVVVVQLADYVAARGVHDGVGDQLGDDQSRRVAGVLADRPAREPGTRQATGLRGRARMGGQLEAEPALGRRTGAQRGCGPGTGAVRGGVCS